MKTCQFLFIILILNACFIQQSQQQIYANYGEYTICMTRMDIGSFRSQLINFCDFQCIWQFMGNSIRMSKSKEDVCVAYNDFYDQELISILDPMPAAEMIACQQAVGLPTSEQAQKVMQKQNECLFR